ncbi:MAG: hypothetical protein KKC39_01355 [Candidatus Omnitrophica bacterium]|nr:hypothetical protein [Candidatus Omnitrophota bacterium]MBU4302944.1 hypothetical protein [Candidatus Omnitrophota bacterium]MBU4467380.1 hypothetical protein [Candidatus Omnitrophota bacterium]MCG2708474.1 hypothetical protein [Candidatus Omnitrophota bacterium]
MPNHLHGAIAIVGAPLVGAQNGDVIADDDRATTRVAPTLGDIIGANEYFREQYLENEIFLFDLRLNCAKIIKPFILNIKA